MEKEQNTEGTKTLMGLADCYGIEYFGIENELPVWLPIRAAANRQRHALIFQVDMTEAQADAVIGQLKEGRYDLALEEVKKCEEVRVEQDMVASWPLIPDPALDPFGPREFAVTTAAMSEELASNPPQEIAHSTDDSEE